MVFIGKKEDGEYNQIFKHHQKLLKSFGVELEDVNVINKEITKAQKDSPKTSQEEYSKALSKYRDECFSVALHPESKDIDSFEFSRLFLDRSRVTFLIGGAYGFDRDFVKSCDISISLSRLTMGHKIAKVVLYEQIYRAFSIINNHPYHK